VLAARLSLRSVDGAVVVGVARRVDPVDHLPHLEPARGKWIMRSGTTGYLQAARTFAASETGSVASSIVSTRAIGDPSAMCLTATHV